MMSKRQFAECLVDRFCSSEKVSREEAHRHILSSSTLSVALEYLGMLSKDEMEYSKERGGCAYTYFGDKDHSPAILTIRDIMSFLPDEDVVCGQ